MPPTIDDVIIQQVIERLSQGESAARIAESLGVKNNALYVAFKKSTGKSVLRYRTPPPARQQAIEMAKAGATLKEISAKIGISLPRVRVWLKQTGILIRPPDPKKVKLAPDKQKALEMICDGATIEEAANAVGKTPRVVWRWVLYG